MYIAIRAVDTVTSESIETKLAVIAARYHFEQQGKEPESVRARVMGDMVLVHSTGIYTPTELDLCGSDEGRKLIKSARRELRSLTRREIEHQIAELLHCKVLRSFWDLDVRSGEQVEVYMLDKSFQTPGHRISLG